MKNRLLIVCLFTVFAAGSAYANTAQHEISQALMQAKQGSKAMSLQQVDTHLHRVVNCLVGQHGVGFDAGAGNPCMGKSAINNFHGGRFDRDSLQQALEDAEYGLMTKHAKIARNAADLAVHSLAQAKAGD